MLMTPNYTHTSEEVSVLERLEHCIEDLRHWMNRNRLKLNDNKTEFIVFGTPHKLTQINTTLIKVGEENIKAVKEVRNISAHFDSVLKMDDQVKSMCRNAWINLYNISKIRKYLTEDQTKTIVHAYVTSKLDYNNSLLAGLTNTENSELRSQLERVQNAAAKLIKQKKSSIMSPLFSTIFIGSLSRTESSLKSCCLHTKPYIKLDQYILKTSLPFITLHPVSARPATHSP